MAKDGKELEALVRYIEDQLLPLGFKVEPNVREYNEDGDQIGEFDVHITGMLGAGLISWLIECRDRPSSGPQSGAWIEQLVARRDRFRFDKVTAVSTTGFAKPAVEYAMEKGIELREVRSLQVESFAHWLRFDTFGLSHLGGELQHAEVVIDPNEPEDVRRALAEVISRSEPSAAILRAVKTGEMVNFATAFSHAVHENGTLYEDIEPNGAQKTIHLINVFPPEDHYVIDTTVGPVRITEIQFLGSLHIKQERVALTRTQEYQNLSTDSKISQLVAFDPIELGGQQLALEFHRMASTDETHVVLRKIKGIDR